MVVCSSSRFFHGFELSQRSLDKPSKTLLGKTRNLRICCFHPKIPFHRSNEKKKKRSFQIPDLSCWKKCHKKKCSQIMSSFAPCSSHSLQIKVTQWQNWEERHLEWQIFIQPRHLAQIDMMMYIHMYRCVYLEIYILCTMFVSISICMYRYMYINYILCRYVCIHVCIYIYIIHMYACVGDKL